MSFFTSSLSTESFLTIGLSQYKFPTKEFLIKKCVLHWYYFTGIIIFAVIEMTVFPGYVFADSPSKCCKSPQNCLKMTELKKNILGGHKYSRTLSKAAKSAKINTNKVDE